jgi:hypothetical protein
MTTNSVALLQEHQNQQVSPFCTRSEVRALHTACFGSALWELGIGVGALI